MKQIIKFYNNKYLKHGNKIKTIGWSNKKDQNLRFKKLFQDLDINNKSILDIGCGFGDMYFYLKKNYNYHFKYSGLDITPKIALIASNRLNRHNVCIYNSDIDNVKKKYDFVVSSGAMSYKYKGSRANSLNLIRKMFKISKYAVSVNFLSDYCDYKLNKNQHFSPETMMKFAKTLTSKVNIIHDYNLYEFTLQMIKK